MNIYDIKRATSETAPQYFTRDTLKFFGQRMSDFRVMKLHDGRIRISAPMRDRSGKQFGESVRYFNPVTNELETV